MKLSVGFMAVLFAVAFGQSFPECTRTLAATDECAAVIDANACYNQNRFNGAATLQCIDGKDNTDRAKKVCKCCNCVGTVMCNWATKQKLC